jgi:tryptophan synthase alpha subunit
MTGIFYTLRHMLSDHALKMIYFAYVNPHIMYGIEAFANICKCCLHKLVVLDVN